MNIAEKILRAKADYDAVYEAGKKAVGEVLKFTDVESTKYRSIVPNGVEPFAKVNKIGGMSYKTRNLIPFPYEIDSSTRLGLTGTVNSDGSITLKGTATEVGRYNVYFIHQGNVFFPKGTTFTIAQQPNATYSKMWYRVSFALGDKSNSVAQLASHSTQTKTLDQNADILQLDINYWTESVGEVVDVTFYPMCNEGTTALPYEPYFEGLRSASVSELKSEGANLFDVDSYTFVAGGSSIIRNTVSNGTLKLYLSQPATSNGWIYAICQKRIPIVNMSQVYMSTNIKRNEITRSLYKVDISDSEGNKVITLKEIYFESDGISSSGAISIPEEYRNAGYELKFTFYLNAGQATSADAYIEYSNIMVSTTTDVYKKYKGTIDTFNIPEFVKSLDGYGLGVNIGNYNYIDYNRKVFVQNVYRKVFDGTENWVAADVSSALGSVYRIRCQLGDKKSLAIGNRDVSLCICNFYNTDTPENTYYGVNKSIACQGSFLNIYDKEYNTKDISLWKAHLAELYANGNPLIVDYVLEEPIETDISEYLTDEYIEVEGGGTVTAVNEYGYDAPTNISYLIDTQGG